MQHLDSLETGLFGNLIGVRGSYRPLEPEKRRQHLGFRTRLQFPCVGHTSHYLGPSRTARWQISVVAIQVATSSRQSAGHRFSAFLLVHHENEQFAVRHRVPLSALAWKLQYPANRARCGEVLKR